MNRDELVNFSNRQGHSGLEFAFLNSLVAVSDRPFILVPVFEINGLK